MLKVHGRTLVSGPFLSGRARLVFHVLRRKIWQEQESSRSLENVLKILEKTYFAAVSQVELELAPHYRGDVEVLFVGPVGQQLFFVDMS